MPLKPYLCQDVLVLRKRAFNKPCKLIQLLLVRALRFSLTVDLLNPYVDIEAEELEIARMQPWKGGPAIFASDGLFGFGAQYE